MPSPFTSSFASAAAGNANSEGGSNGRNSGSGEWSRARTNGATTTFRRPSVATNLSQQKDNTMPNSNTTASGPSVYVPPHLNSAYQSNFARNGSSDTRYSKDQLLEMFKNQGKTGSTSANVDDLYVDGWSPENTNGTTNGGWGKRDDHKEGGPEICWDREGTVHPMALLGMTDEEREAFSSSVNSPLKPPAQNKDGTPNGGPINRRTSITQSQNALNDSPSARPGTRRRDSGDLLQSSNPLASPKSISRFAKEESAVSSPPPSFLRRKTDNKESFGPGLDDKEKNASRPSFDTSNPLWTLKRTSTNPVGPSLNGPSSPWTGAPSSAGFSPMGTFGNFGATQVTAPGEKKPGFGGVRVESRFKGLMGADNSEGMNNNLKEKIPLNSLEEFAESKKEQSRSPWESGRSVQQTESNRNSYEEDEQYPAGSAALGGDEHSPPPQSSRYRNSDRQSSYDDIGFSSMGLSSEMPPFRDLMHQRREYPNQQTPQRNQGMSQMHEPMSPTDTNPYQSPEGNKTVPEDIDTDDMDFHNQQFSRNSAFSRGFHNQLDLGGNDQSQTPSRNTTRGFPNLGGLGGVSGLSGTGPWSAAPGAVGTPSRTQPPSAGFGDSSFGSLGDLTSPAHAGFGGAGFFGSAVPSSTANTTVGRGSKLSSLFPNAMQDQVRNDPSRQDPSFGDSGDVFQRQAGNNAPGFGVGIRDADNPSQVGRSRLDEFLGSSEDRFRGLQGLGSPFTTAEPSQNPVSTAAITPFSAAASTGGYFATNQDQDPSSAASQMPASQQRQMVMPDRMRWIYRDPQGNQQGPWSGLEMHDWYKAGFFSPELQVKKLEDTEYEPLAQLIRRIGNSREPFLVPQIGIPHGPANAPPNAAAAAVPASTPSAAQSSSAQPPFAGSFPSFGTTLTAEQQNALERRKQEEQYLMARQKEHLVAMQPVIQQRQLHHMQGGLHGQQLHHHSSAHSLQSQPSYGSITSPTGYQPSPSGGPIQPPSSVAGFFEGISRNPGPLGADALGSVREEDLPAFMERMNMGRGAQLPYSAASYNNESQNHQQQVNSLLQERTRLRREQEQYDRKQRVSDEPRGTAERLEQFQQLRSQEDDPEHQQQGPIGEDAGRQHGQQPTQLPAYQEEQLTHDQRPSEQLSLSEQVQKAAAKQSPGMQVQPPWAKVDASIPQPFPPPQSSSPMPAPTPQRNRQSVADALNAESQSPQPDSAETPSAALAPWAKENTEVSKGPSLKEIQAMEARKAAQQEEIAAAARRAVAEQERLSLQQNQPPAPAPGLPSSANWASSISPAVPATSGPSPWLKPATGKPTGTTPVTGAKKTLAQIQKEEEARKNRAAAAAVANPGNAASSAANTAGGKRYADLASKVALPAPQNSSNSAWTTVGASGKVKAPATPTPTANTRTASGGIVQPASSAAKSKPTVSTTKTGSSQQNANEEFQKWTKSALSKGLHSNIPLDDFVHSLLLLPPEADIISDSIYASSQTLDGRRFAEEFVRRRRLADRGIVPDSGASAGFSSPSNGAEGKGGGGWSEVAKKGGAASGGSGGAAGGNGKEEGSAFMVVKGKKKGGKR